MIVPKRINQRGRVVPEFQVDDHLAEAVLKHKWCIDACGYMTSRIGKDRELIRLHRFVWRVFYGELPRLIDHINRDRLDNRLCNLRSATDSLNGLNKDSPQRASGLPQGVCFHRAAQKYMAQIMLHKQSHYLGLFATPEEAEAAYLAAKSAVLGIS